MIFVKRSILVISQYVNSRAFASGVLAVILACAIYYMTTVTNAITIRDDTGVRYAFTQAQSASDILNEQGIQTIERDRVTFPGFSGKYGEIIINRAFPINISADGNRQQLYVLGGSVKDALEQAGVLIDSDDLINRTLSSTVVEDDNIVVNRVNFNVYEETEDIDYNVIDKHSPLIRSGTSRLLSSGHGGSKDLVIEEKYVDGKLKETNIVSEVVTREAEDQIMLRGAKVPVSPMEAPSGYELDENGTPQNYTNVLTNQVATAYSCAPGMWGSSGLPAVTGYVAVDPKVIPYGTRLYIATPDNSFVYGYCIAGDTGTGLIDGVIDVDLMFDSYLESALFGKKSMNIYILE
ncbi:MAG: G5 domain-containing protein [Acetanaerobacterium sp.]